MTRRRGRPNKILDTSVLVSFWQRHRHRVKSAMQAGELGIELAALHACDLIFTPVYIEFLVGARDPRELTLFRSFLSTFVILDDGRIPAAVWDEAKRLAARVRRDGRPRQLGDCLIQAFANARGCIVVTLDAAFPN